MEKYVGKPIRGPMINERSSDLSEPILKSMDRCYIVVQTRLDDRESIFLFSREYVSEKGEEGKEMSGIFVPSSDKTFVAFPDVDL